MRALNYITQPGKRREEMDLIGKATRNEFSLVGFVLRDIEMFFDGAGLACNQDYTPPISGARRSLVERYYANINVRPANQESYWWHGEIVLADRSGFSGDPRTISYG